MIELKKYGAMILLAALATSAWAGGKDDNDDDGVCKATAKLQKKAAYDDLKEELNIKLGECLNLTDSQARKDCLKEAKADYEEGKDLAKEQYEARIDLCKLLGGTAYDPDIDPGQFSTVIDNPYLPFPVGAVWNFQSLTDEGLENIQVSVLPDTRVIVGVECVTVHDVVYLDGEVIEDTLDWYAQDAAGNVWYFGEISFSYEDGYVANIDGSWLAGVDGAKPGIVMLADPVPGITYRQEWFLGDAEDAATVLEDDVSVTIGIGTFDHCVETLEFLPPDPDAKEHKFYAPGIGFIYETKEGSTETLELISFSGV